MMSWLWGAITSRVAGPVAGGVAVALTILLAACWLSWEADRAGLEAQVLELRRQAERSQSLWKAQLSACHAAGQVAPAQPVGLLGAPNRAGDAAVLLQRGPQGIDACARMESADQAVLANLK